MKTCPTTRRVKRSLDLDLLTTVLARLEHDLLADDPGHGVVMFGVAETDADGVTLATRHLDVPDPVEAMVGFTAPAEWSAFGLITRGRSRQLLTVDPRPRVDPDAAPSPVRLAVVATRSGRVLSGLRTGDGPFTVHDECGEPLGRIPDGCRRVLGLGTPPPEAGVEEFFALLWVDHVLAAAMRRPGELTWPEAAGLHFGAGLVAELIPAGHGDLESMSPDELLGLGHALTGEQVTWGFIRRQAARQPAPSDLFHPEAATWMDDGMFSRELLGSFPSVDGMLEALGQVAAPIVVGSVERTLDSWHLW